MHYLLLLSLSKSTGQLPAMISFFCTEEFNLSISLHSNFCQEEKLSVRRNAMICNLMVHLHLFSVQWKFIHEHIKVSLFKKKNTFT